jgi:hypothetical protein
MEFTNTELDNRALIIKMLQYEDSLILGPVGKEIYEDNSFEHYSSHEAMYIIHRITLNYFGFQTKDEDVQNYRKIFSKYYESPTKYDAEVLQSVVYMRENKLVYKTSFEKYHLYGFIRNDLSWHSVDNILMDSEYLRRSINININFS